MDNKIREWLSAFANGDKKRRLIIIIGIVGISLILLSELIPSGSTDRSKSESNNDYSSYVESLEEKTEGIISSIDGVGRCEVMITISATDESIFAKNTDENENSGSYSKKSEYVFYEADNGDAPVLIKQNLPRVQGVLVVCEGGDNIVVRETVIRSITSLFNISSGKVSVSKISGNR